MARLVGGSHYLKRSVVAYPVRERREGAAVRRVMTGRSRCGRAGDELRSGARSRRRSCSTRRAARRCGERRSVGSFERCGGRCESDRAWRGRARFAGARVWCRLCGRARGRWREELEGEGRFHRRCSARESGRATFAAREVEGFRRRVADVWRFEGRGRRGAFRDLGIRCWVATARGCAGMWRASESVGVSCAGCSGCWRAVCARRRIDASYVSGARAGSCAIVRVAFVCLGGRACTRRGVAPRGACGSTRCGGARGSGWRGGGGRSGRARSSAGRGVEGVGAPAEGRTGGVARATAVTWTSVRVVVAPFGGSRARWAVGWAVWRLAVREVERRRFRCAERALCPA